MHPIILILISATIGFFFGWYMSKFFYRVPQMLELIELMGEVLQGKLSQEEAAERFKKIKV